MAPKVPSPLATLPTALATLPTALATLPTGQRRSLRVDLRRLPLAISSLPGEPRASVVERGSWPLQLRRVAHEHRSLRVERRSLGVDLSRWPLEPGTLPAMPTTLPGEPTRLGGTKRISAVEPSSLGGGCGKPGSPLPPWSACGRGRPCHLGRRARRDVSRDSRRGGPSVGSLRGSIAASRSPWPLERLLRPERAPPREPRSHPSRSAPGSRPRSGP